MNPETNINSHSLNINEAINQSLAGTSSSKTVKFKSNSKSKGPEISSSVFDNNFTKKTPTLIPRQRLAIPQKYGKNFERNGLVLEVEATQQPVLDNKPLVQWESDESEEELSFFPKSKIKSTLTDNMSVENMSLSGDDEDEEDDLHLTPPKPSSNCPCDPRLLLENTLHYVRGTSFSLSNLRDRINIESCVVS